MAVAGGVEILRSQYFAKFKDGVEYPTVPSSVVRSEATFDGIIDELAEKYPELSAVLYNDVKACPNCGKPCAYSMTTCNACATCLKEVEITKSENVFSAFLFGVKRAKRGFPYTVSLRRQTPDVLVFDDMLALTPCHFDGIPAKHYIPDWRFLLTDPLEGLKVIDQIEEECWAATLEFFRDEKFRTAIFKGGITEEELKGKVIKSFNFPPSQFQLHIQWLVPPLTPFQHFMAEIRNHFHEDRAFPIAYVRKVLELNKPYKVCKDTPIEEIVAYYDGLGINYKQHWNEFYQKSLADSMQLANWRPEDFEYVVEDGKAYNFSVEGGQVVKGAQVEGFVASDVQKLDCAAIQNYGRPYDGGRPSGTYVQTPLKPMLGPGGYEAWPGVFSD